MFTSVAHAYTCTKQSKNPSQVVDLRDWRSGQSEKHFTDTEEETDRVLRAHVAVRVPGAGGREPRAARVLLLAAAGLRGGGARVARRAPQAAQENQGCRPRCEAVWHPCVCVDVPSSAACRQKRDVSHFVFLGIDYKKLMEAEAKPLDVLRPVLNSSNVHVIAKLAPKIPDQVRLRLFGFNCGPSHCQHAIFLVRNVQK